MAENDSQPNAAPVPASTRAAAGQPLWQRPLGWFAGGAALGYGASFLVHLAAFLGCSLVVVAGARLPEMGIIAASSA
jgi:hypothetical protein